MDSPNELTPFDVCCHLVAEYLRRKYERGENFVNIHELRGLLSVDFGSDSPTANTVMEMVVCGRLVSGNPSLDGRCEFRILRSVRDVPFLISKVDATGACLEHRQAGRYGELNRERSLALERWQEGRAIKAETPEAATDDGGKGKRTRGKTVTGKKRGRKPATDDEIEDACEVWIEYQKSKKQHKEFCVWWNGRNQVGCVAVTHQWLKRQLALVRKLMRDEPHRIPAGFAKKLKPLRRVKRAV